MKIKKELKAGAILVVTVIVFVWGFSFLKGRNLLKPADTYYVVYDRVDGLNESDPVKVQGYRVGLVSDMRLGSGMKEVIVKITVDAGHKIPRNTVARIYSTDFMGTKAIELDIGDHTQYCSPGDTLNAAIEPEIAEEIRTHLLPLKNSLEDLTASADSVLKTFHLMFDEDFRDNFSKTVEKTSKTVESLQRSVYSVDTLITGDQNRLYNIVSNLDSASGNISAVSDSLAAADLMLAVGRLNALLESSGELIEKVNRGEGSIGQLVKDEQMYRNLDSAAKNLDSLLIDLRENPGKYVNFSIFGRRGSGFED